MEFRIVIHSTFFFVFIALRFISSEDSWSLTSTGGLEKRDLTRSASWFNLSTLLYLGTGKDIGQEVYCMTDLPTQGT